VLFRSALKYFLDPKFVEIKYKIDGKTSSFSVPGELQVEFESFKNPVTRHESYTEVHLPEGFIFQTAQACKAKIMRIVSAKSYSRTPARTPSSARSSRLEDLSAPQAAVGSPA
jgi:hypothetical protein